jgi:hypothetical protein
VLYFDAAEEKTHAAPYEFQGRLRGFVSFLKCVFANQRSVTGGSPDSAAAVVSQQVRQAWPAAWLVRVFIAIVEINPYPLISQDTAEGEVPATYWARWPTCLTNDLDSFRLVTDAFLHRQHGLSPFQQFLLLYGLSVCVRVL